MHPFDALNCRVDCLFSVVIHGTFLNSVFLSDCSRSDVYLHQLLCSHSKLVITFLFCFIFLYLRTQCQYWWWQDCVAWQPAAPWSSYTLGTDDFMQRQLQLFVIEPTETRKTTAQMNNWEPQQRIQALITTKCYYCDNFITSSVLALLQWYSNCWSKGLFLYFCIDSIQDNAIVYSSGGRKCTPLFWWL